MAKPAPPESKSYCKRAITMYTNIEYAQTVKKFMDKRLLVNLQGNRRVTGMLRGFDIFLNIVLDEARDETVPGREENIVGGPVVRDEVRIAW